MCRTRYVDTDVFAFLFSYSTTSYKIVLQPGVEQLPIGQPLVGLHHSLLQSDVSKDTLTLDNSNRTASHTTYTPI